MRKIETILAHLEQELDVQMRGASTKPDLVKANQLLEGMTQQLDQAIIFDKTIRVHLEGELEALREILQSADASASRAKERLKDFRRIYQESFSSGQIV